MSVIRSPTDAHTLIAEHMGAPAAVATEAPVSSEEAGSSDEVNMDALPDDDLDQLLGDASIERPLHIEAAVLEVRV